MNNVKFLSLHRFMLYIFLALVVCQLSLIILHVDVSVSAYDTNGPFQCTGSGSSCGVQCNVPGDNEYCISKKTYCCYDPPAPTPTPTPKPSPTYQWSVLGEVDEPCGPSSDCPCGNTGECCTACSCTSSGGCSNVGPSKYRQSAKTVSANKTVCSSSSDCNPSVTTQTCTVYKNTPPSCSLSLNIDDPNFPNPNVSYTSPDGSNPATITVYYTYNKPESIPLKLTVTDKDYGDQVVISGISDEWNGVNNVIGKLLLSKDVVKDPSDDPSHITQDNIFQYQLLDPLRIANIGSTDPRNPYPYSLTTLTVQIKDEKGDNDDSSAVATCSINIKAVYRPPTADFSVCKDDNCTSKFNLNNTIKIGSTINNPYSAYTQVANYKVCQKWHFDSDEKTLICTQTYRPGSFPLANNPLTISTTAIDPDGIYDLRYIAGGFLKVSEVNPSPEKYSLPNRTLWDLTPSNYYRINIDNGNGVVKGVVMFTDIAGYYKSKLGNPEDMSNWEINGKLVFSTVRFHSAFNLDGTEVLVPKVTPSPNDAGWEYKHKDLLSSGILRCSGEDGGHTCNNVNAALTNLDTNDQDWSNYFWDIGFKINNWENNKNSYTLAISNVDDSKNSKLYSNGDPGVSSCLDSYRSCVQLQDYQRLDHTHLNVKVKTFFTDNIATGDYYFLEAIGDKYGGAFKNSYGNWWVSPIKTNNTVTENFIPLDEDTEDNKVIFKLDNVPPSLEQELALEVGDKITVKLIANDNHILSNPFYNIVAYGCKFDDLRGKEVCEFLTSDNNRIINGSSLGDAPFGGSIADVKDADNNVIGKSYTFTIKGIRGGEKIHVGFCAVDSFGNAKCSWGGNTDDIAPPIIDEIGANWLKTSLGDVYSKNGFSGLPKYNGLAQDDEGNNLYIEGEDRLPNAFRPQGQSISSFLYSFKSDSWGEGTKYGYQTLPFNNSNFKLDNLDINPPNGQSWYDLLYSTAIKNCAKLGNNCANLTENELADYLNNSIYKYKIIELTSDINITDDQVTCNGVNLIFLKSVNLTLRNIKKSNANSGCVFIADSNSTMTIEDNSEYPDDGSNLDEFDAGIIILNANDGALTVKQTPRDDYRDSSGNFDRLILNGFIYSLSVPKLERDLVFSDNEQYPSEWIVYDSSLLNKFKPVLARYKVQSFNCGAVNHPYCSLEME